MFQDVTAQKSKMPAGQEAGAHTAFESLSEQPGSRTL